MRHRWLWGAVVVAGVAAGGLVGSPAAAAPGYYQISTTSVDFGPVPLGGTASASVYVTSSSSTPVNTVTDGGTGNAAFTSSNNCKGAALSPGVTCRFVFTFAPSTLGLFTAKASFRLEYAFLLY